MKIMQKDKTKSSKVQRSQRISKLILRALRYQIIITSKNYTVQIVQKSILKETVIKAVAVVTNGTASKVSATSCIG